MLMAEGGDLSDAMLNGDLNRQFAGRVQMQFDVDKLRSKPLWNVVMSESDELKPRKADDTNNANPSAPGRAVVKDLERFSKQVTGCFSSPSLLRPKANHSKTFCSKA